MPVRPQFSRHINGADVAVVPVKAFGSAKQRLAQDLSPQERKDLALSMANRVVKACRPLVVVIVCDDSEVADWAVSLDASVSFTPGLGLNGALDLTLTDLSTEGAKRAIIAHADLPFAHDVESIFGKRDASVAVLCPDRHGDGTNVVSVPLQGLSGSGFRCAYGPGSFREHWRRCVAAGWQTEIVNDESWAWDIDRPIDLHPPAHIGTIEVPTSPSATHPTRRAEPG